MAASRMTDTTSTHVANPLHLRLIRFLCALVGVSLLILFAIAVTQYLRDVGQGCLCEVVNIRHEEDGFRASPGTRLLADNPFQAGEALIAIDGTPLTAGMSAAQALNLVRGEIGTPVTLRLRSADGTPRSLTFTRVADLSLQDSVAAGFSLPASIAYSVGTDIALVFAALSTAGLIVARRSDDWYALLTALSLLFYLIGLTNAALHLSLLYQAESSLRLFAQAFYFVADAAIMFGVLTFPTGRFEPRWTLLNFLFVVVIDAYMVFTNDITYLMLIVQAAALLVVPLYRYRFVLGKVERQQAKLAMLGIIGLLVLTILLSIMGGVNAWVRGPSNLTFTNGFPFYAKLLVNLGFLGVLVSLALALIRSHLWGVDVVINRSLVYAGVTVALGVIFLVGLFALQMLLQAALGGEQSAMAATLSTGVVFLLFNPVRRRVRSFIDRRIYGFRFDLNALERGQAVPHIQNPGALTGKSIAGFEILGLLGTGAMGEVYQAQLAERQAAIKVIPALFSQEPEFRKRLEREAQTLANLKHPHVVQYYGAGELDGMYFIVLEFIDGQDLKFALAAHGKFDWSEVRSWMQDIASALDYIHQRGLVHRDIKPSNIMLRRNPQTKLDEAVLMDFGIAKLQSADTQLTAVGSFMGTIDYMAPEQIMAAQEVDQRADIYALGIVLYELLTGERPFSGSAAQILFAHREQPAPNPRDINPQVPVHVAIALLKALEKQPENRQASVMEFFRTLSEADALDGVGITLI